MTSRAQEVLQQALTLAAEERADVAAELLSSLEDTVDSVEQVESEWAAEIERRARRVLTEQSAGTSWEEVRRRADEELRRR